MVDFYGFYLGKYTSRPMDPTSRDVFLFKTVNVSGFAINSIKNEMGPNPNGPHLVSCDRAMRYSGLFGVRSGGPTVGDFLDKPFLEAHPTPPYESTSLRRESKNNWR